jgi:peptide/nickel transport system permease protein
VSLAPASGRLLRDPRALFGLGVLGLFAAAAALAPWISPHDPDLGLGRPGASLRPPGGEFLLGTDLASRDVLSRLLHGARVSLAVGAAAAALATTLGVAVGAVAGEAGGLLDSALLRITDFFLAVPRLVVLLAAGAFLGRSPLLVVAFLGLTGWMGTARLVRAEVAALRGREFVLAARGLGQTRARVLWRHVLPNAAGAAVVSATLGLGGALAAEASLSFLGFGVPPPMASWGSMVADGVAVIRRAWWVSAFPVLAIALCVTAASLLGDALREARDDVP